MDILPIAILIVFIGTYVIISTERVDRTGMSLLGMALVGVVFWAASLLTPGVEISFIDLVEQIEWDTILFVTAMMIIVAVAGGSGMFQYLALRLARPSGGDYKGLYTIFLLFVFVISLVVDNVSILLIMAPLTIQVCRALGVDFKPLLISEAIVTNLGSIPSIVGAVTNIVIVKETGLDASLLFVVFMPLSIILFIVTWIVLTRYFADSFVVSDMERVDLLFQIEPTTMIKSKPDFYASLIAFAALVIGFALSASLELSVSMLALLIAAALLVFAHDRATKFLGEVGWDTIFFLVGLFGLVGALELTGWIGLLGDSLGVIVGDNAIIALTFMIWIPAILAAFLDNLPVSLVLAPIALRFTTVSPVLTYALIFAVNIGGNIFTPLGSASNMVAIAHSEREHDPISFADFAKAGTLAGMFHLILGTIWVLLIEFLGIIPVVVGGLILGAALFKVFIFPVLRNPTPVQKNKSS
jgi:Na+/H+ antiporter NhaD/arsenite permease-like protein